MSSGSRIPLPGGSRIPQPASSRRRQSVSAPRRDSLGCGPARRESSSGALANRSNAASTGATAVPGPPKATRRAPRPSSLTTKPAYDPTAAVRAKAEKLEQQKKAREDRMAAKRSAEAAEAEARRQKAEALANAKQDRLIGARPGGREPKSARRSSIGVRSRAPTAAAAAASPAAASPAAASVKPPAVCSSPVVKKPRVDPNEHARKKQEAMAQAKKLREERMAESKRRAAERKAEKAREEEARLQRLQDGGNPFGTTPAVASVAPPVPDPDASASEPAPEAPQATESVGKRKDETSQQEQTERLKRQKQAQLEARMANPHCLRNSSCQCKDCAVFNPAPKVEAVETVEEAPPPVAIETVAPCLRTSSCTCDDCARQRSTVAEQAAAPPASPVPGEAGTCLRTSDCRCDECAELATAMSVEDNAQVLPIRSPAPQAQQEPACQRNLSCACPECANVRDVKLLAATPVKPSATTQEDKAVENACKPGGFCLRSSDCQCDSCEQEKTGSPLAAQGLGAALQQAIAPPLAEAPQQEPQSCPDLPLELGTRIDAQDGTGGWYESFVVDSRAGEVQVHYIGWPYTWDEWLPLGSVRLQHLRTFTKPDGTSVGPDGQETIPTRRTNSGTETPVNAKQDGAEDEDAREKKDEDAPAVSKALEGNRLEVQEFLDSCGMNIRSYASKLAAHGFDELSCLKCAQLEDLTTAGVLVGHARKIMAALAKENGEPTASPAQREMESGWNSATTPDKQDEEYDGDMPIETVTLPDDQAAAAVTATPSTAQRRARRGNFLLERTASSAEKFMCHGINGAGVEAAAASAAAIDVPIETAATSSPPLAPVQSGSSSPPLPAASPMAASIGSGLYEFPMDGAEEAVEITLVACACCSRKFSEQNIAKHEKNCKKQTTKRKAFSAADQRAAAIAAANGTDGPQSGPPMRKSKKARQMEKAEQARKDAEAKKVKEEASARWKAESAQFREAMKNNRLIAQAQKDGTPLSEVDFGPSSEQPASNMVGCPHCGRSFNETAGPRHIASCAKRTKK